jgi:hypothetical protein
MNFIIIIIIIIIIISFIIKGNRDSSVYIATYYSLNGPGIESRWREIFRISSDRPWGPPSILYSEYRVFPGAKAAGACL